MSQGTTITGVGRLYRGQRSLGCVGYRLQQTEGGQMTVAEFDPAPDGTHGDVFSLHLSDGRLVECEAREGCQWFQIIGSGPHPERRGNRRPPSGVRFLV